MRLDPWLHTAARLFGFFLMCSAWAFYPATTHAQESADTARDASARELFEQGVKLGEQGDWASAEDRFRRAFSLRLSPVIAYNLASALSEQGKLIEASETLRRVLLDDKTEPGLRQSATQLQAELGPRIGRVQVEVQGQEHEDSVLLDGHVLHTAQLDVEIPADPGSHQLQLERAGKTIDLQTFNLPPGGRQQVRLVAPALTATPLLAATATDASSASAAPETKPTQAAQPSLFSRWWFWTGVVAVVGIGTLVGAAASSGVDRVEPSYKGSLGSVRVEVAQ